MPPRHSLLEDIPPLLTRTVSPYEVAARSARYHQPDPEPPAVTPEIPLLPLERTKTGSQTQRNRPAVTTFPALSWGNKTQRSTRLPSASFTARRPLPTSPSGPSPIQTALDIRSGKPPPNIPPPPRVEPVVYKSPSQRKKEEARPPQEHRPVPENPLRPVPENPLTATASPTPAPPIIHVEEPPPPIPVPMHEPAPVQVPVDHVDPETEAPSPEAAPETPAPPALTIPQPSLPPPLSETEGVALIDEQSPPVKEASTTRNATPKVVNFDADVVEQPETSLQSPIMRSASSRSVEKLARRMSKAGSLTASVPDKESEEESAEAPTPVVPVVAPIAGRSRTRQSRFGGGDSKGKAAAPSAALVKDSPFFKKPPPEKKKPAMVASVGKGASPVGLKTKDKSKMVDLLDPRLAKDIYRACNFVREKLHQSCIGDEGDPTVIERDRAFLLWSMLFCAKMEGDEKQHPVATSVAYICDHAQGELATEKAKRNAPYVIFYAKSIIRPVLDHLSGQSPTAVVHTGGKDVSPVTVAQDIADTSRVLIGEKPPDWMERIPYITEVVSGWSYHKTLALYKENKPLFESLWNKLLDSFDDSRQEGTSYLPIVSEVLATVS